MRLCAVLPAALLAAAPLLAGGADGTTMPLPEGHLVYTEYRMLARTDKHNELVWRLENLVGRNEEAFEVRSAVFSYEDLLTGKGKVFLRLGPLPQERPDTTVPDITVDTRKRLLTVHDNGYPFVALDYEGGRRGRTKALQDYQRSVRPYVPGRDGVFMSNTWGDRSQDARVCESFMLKEVEAAAELGLDAVQIDDGWQKGKSINAVNIGTNGIFVGFWRANPHFWEPDEKKFPDGFGNVAKAAKEKGLSLGLWFCPDSADDAASWERDAALMLDYHRRFGVDYFKLDSMRTTSKLAFSRQRMLFERIMKETNGRLVIDLDVTADKRPGYFGILEAGPLFVENRYTDWHTYWPHLTLRSLWSLTEVVDPVRLRIEVLNPERNKEKYFGDPLAPANYPPETLFAIAMTASPLGWFETQSLSPDTMRAWRPVVAAWKREREAMAACNVFNVGAKPDGLSWTGFVSVPRRAGAPGYALFFRELSKSPRFDFDFSEYFPRDTRIEVLSSRGQADMKGVSVNSELDFVWAKFTPEKGKGHE